VGYEHTVNRCFIYPDCGRISVSIRFDTLAAALHIRTTSQFFGALSDAAGGR
jgi:hypothetical protein